MGLFTRKTIGISLAIMVTVVIFSVGFYVAYSAVIKRPTSTLANKINDEDPYVDLRKAFDSGLILSQHWKNLHKKWHDAVVIVGYDNSEKSAFTQFSRGFFVSRDGLMLTTYHSVLGVLEKIPSDREISIITSSRKVYAARIVYANPLVDVALLKTAAQPNIWFDLSKNSEPVNLDVSANVLFFTKYDIFDEISHVNRSASDIANYESKVSKINKYFIHIDNPLWEGSSGSPVVLDNSDILGVSTSVWKRNYHTILTSRFTLNTIFDEYKDKRCFLMSSKLRDSQIWYRVYGFSQNPHPNERGLFGMTPVMACVRGAHRELLLQMLSHSEVDLTIRDGFGNNAAINAILSTTEDPAPLEILLSFGADPDSVSSDGVYLIDIAVIRHFDKHVRLLLKHGANVTHRDEEGATCMMRAAAWASPDLLELFVRYGSRTDTINWSGYTIYNYAIHNQNPESLEYLLDYTHAKNINLSCAFGETPLMLAAMDGTFEHIKLLLEYGADPKLTSNIGYTAYDYLSMRKSNESIQDIRNLLLVDTDNNSHVIEHGSESLNKP